METTLWPWRDNKKIDNRIYHLSQNLKPSAKASSV
jgi:hypothetical protein